MDTNEDAFPAAHVAYIQACQKANQAREEVRNLAIIRASAVYSNEPAGMTALLAARDALHDAEQAEAAAYDRLWAIANEPR